MNNEFSMIVKATILVTNICNFKCKHCFWGDVKRQEQITDEKLENVVKMCIANEIKHICFSGGEPILFLDKIVKVMKLYKNKFSKISICTNGFWGLDATRVCDKLLAAGISNIELSYDTYHAEYMDFEIIKNILDIAKEKNIDLQCIVSVAEDKDIIQFQYKMSQYIEPKNIIFQYVGPYGAGSNVETKNSKYQKKKCIQFMRQICVDFNGLLYYCCGPYVTLGVKTNFCLGEFNQLNIDRLKEDNQLYEIMNMDFSEDNYMCEECLNRLDNYILSMGMCRCNK